MIRGLFILAALAVLSACAAPERSVVRVPSTQPQKAAVAGVPLIRQAAFHCGPTALAMVMQWSGGNVTPEALARQAFTPGARGTYTADMLGAARRRGQLATRVQDFAALLAEVSAGHPVIVLQNLGLRALPVWHYGVVVGYDLAADRVTLHSGEREVMEMTVGEFLSSWRGGGAWALTVLPPGRLPAAAPRRDILEAASALERVGDLAAAERAYRAGEARWPGDWLWAFGLGNTLYAQGDRRGARQAFRRAATLAPDAPEPRNNLAVIEEELAAG